MRSVNKIILVGNLTRDPEMRQTPNGQNVSTFGIATNRQWVTKEGEKKNSAEFHECVAWARLAEICSSYLKKGHLVYLEGYLKTRSWDSPEGVKKFKTEIVVQDMIMLEKRSSDEGEQSEPESPKSEKPEASKQADVEIPPEEFDDGIPTVPEQEEESKEERSDDPTPITSDTPADVSPIDKDLGL